MSDTKLTQEQLDNLLMITDTLPAPEALAANSRIFQALATLDRKDLARLFIEKAVAPGDIVFREGDEGDAMYLIWSGRAVVVKGDPASPTVLAHRVAGEVVGEMAVLEGRPRSASVVALNAMRLLKISRDSFQTLLDTNPKIAMDLMSSLSARLREADVVINSHAQTGKQLERRLSRLQTEKVHLEELTRIRQETTDLIVHDLRSPLSIINNVLQLMEMTLPEDALQKSRELLDMAHDAMGRLIRLINAMLDTARMESGEEPFNFAPVDLLPVFEDVAKSVPPSLRQQGLKVRLRVAPDLPPVVADVQKIERVLLNLLDNAVKHSPADGTITLLAQAGSDRVTVSVTDTGPGIPLEERERIFERFTQVAGEAIHRRGFGLGLTFCKLAVNAHNGDIWVEPGDDGVGSRFIFTLPIAEQA